MDYQDFQKIRKEYEDNGIEVHDLDDSPLKQLEYWLDEAALHSPGSWFETNAMALATSDNQGIANVRYVLLKGIDNQGIRFFTNYESQKGRELSANPNCSVAFHWPFMGRQIRITGTVTKTNREISEQYFHSRPRQAQFGAAISNQSDRIRDRAELEQKMQAYVTKIGDDAVPLPDNWGGYQVSPHHFEFWQGRTGRLHDRIVYQQQQGEWTKFRLAP